MTILFCPIMRVTPFTYNTAMPSSSNYILLLPPMALTLSLFTTHNLPSSPDIISSHGAYSLSSHNSYPPFFSQQLPSFLLTTVTLLSSHNSYPPFFSQQLPSFLLITVTLLSSHNSYPPFFSQQLPSYLLTTVTLLSSHNSYPPFFSQQLPSFLLTTVTLLSSHNS